MRGVSVEVRKFHSGPDFRLLVVMLFQMSGQRAEIPSTVWTVLPPADCAAGPTADVYVYVVVYVCGGRSQRRLEGG